MKFKKLLEGRLNLNPGVVKALFDSRSYLSDRVKALEDMGVSVREDDYAVGEIFLPDDEVIRVDAQKAGYVKVDLLDDYGETLERDTFDSASPLFKWLKRWVK
jgi:hypothetical protein